MFRVKKLKKKKKKVIILRRRLVLCEGSRLTNGTASLFQQRPERLNEKPSVLPAVEVIAPGGSYNPDFFAHQVMPQSHLHAFRGCSDTDESFPVAA